jgi:hypothetical protein
MTFGKSPLLPVLEHWKYKEMTHQMIIRKLNEPMFFEGAKKMSEEPKTYRGRVMDVLASGMAEVLSASDKVTRFLLAKTRYYTLKTGDVIDIVVNKESKYGKEFKAVRRIHPASGVEGEVDMVEEFPLIEIDQALMAMSARYADDYNGELLISLQDGLPKATMVFPAKRERRVAKLRMEEAQKVQAAAADMMINQQMRAQEERNQEGDRIRQEALRARSVDSTIMTFIDDRVRARTRFRIRSIEKRSGPRYDRQVFTFYLCEQAGDPRDGHNFSVVISATDRTIENYRSDRDFWQQMSDYLLTELCSDKYRINIESSYRGARPRYSPKDRNWWGETGPSENDYISIKEQPKINPFIDSASHVEI